MRRRLDAWVRRWWAGEAGWSGRMADVLLAPAEALYRGATRLRNRRWDRRGGISVDGVRVISVGNLAVGGTGKTPVSGWIVGRLAAAGSSPALVSRGYGRDELMLHHRWNPEVPVIAAPNRVEGAREAVRSGARVVVLDDGFQHRRLARDADIVLLAAEAGLPGRLLPRGPFREGASALRRATLVVVTRRTADLSEATALAERAATESGGVPWAIVRLAPGRWRTLQGGAAERPVGAVLAAAAIARPEEFAANVAEAGAEGVELVAYPDHFVYGAGDVEELRRRARGRPIVVTEKDAVKLAGLALSGDDLRVLTQEVRWDVGEEHVDALLRGLLPA